MSAPRCAALMLAFAAMLLAGGCQKEKPPPPKVDAAAGEAARAALERVQRDAFGAQVKSLEKARTIEADVNTKATESLEKIDKDTR